MLSDLWYYKQNPVKEGAPVKNTRLLALVILLIVVVAAIFRFWDVVMLFFLSAIIEAESDRYDSHDYLDSIKTGENREFQQAYKNYSEKYAF